MKIILYTELPRFQEIDFPEQHAEIILATVTGDRDPRSDAR